MIKVISNYIICSADGETTSERLKRQVRVVVMVITAPKNMNTRTVAVRDTWGRHGDVVYIRYTCCLNSSYFSLLPSTSLLTLIHLSPYPHSPLSLPQSIISPLTFIHLLSYVYPTIPLSQSIHLLTTIHLSSYLSPSLHLPSSIYPPTRIYMHPSTSISLPQSIY